MEEQRYIVKGKIKSIDQLIYNKGNLIEIRFTIGRKTASHHLSFHGEIPTYLIGKIVTHDRTERKKYFGLIKEIVEHIENHENENSEEQKFIISKTRQYPIFDIYSMPGDLKSAIKSDYTK